MMFYNFLAVLIFFCSLLLKMGKTVRLTVMLLLTLKCPQGNVLYIGESVGRVARERGARQDQAVRLGAFSTKFSFIYPVLCNKMWQQAKPAF